MTKNYYWELDLQVDFAMFPIFPSTQAAFAQYFSNIANAVTYEKVACIRNRVAFL